MKTLPDGLPENGYVRIRQMIRPGGPLPCSKSTIWNYVRARRLTPIKVSSRVTVFDVREVRQLLNYASKTPSPIHGSEVADA